jgi:hypothetical protein
MFCEVAGKSVLKEKCKGCSTFPKLSPEFAAFRDSCPVWQEILRVAKESKAERMSRVIENPFTLPTDEDPGVAY